MQAIYKRSLLVFLFAVLAACMVNTFEETRTYQPEGVMSFDDCVNLGVDPVECNVPQIKFSTDGSVDYLTGDIMQRGNYVKEVSVITIFQGDEIVYTMTYQGNADILVDQYGTRWLRQ